jgi:Zn-dependent M28 family amino/carboxypeptidase
VQGTHSALSGLVAMLVAADLLRSGGRSSAYERDIVFVALSGEAYDLMASRRLLYDLSHKGQDRRARANLAGLELEHIESILEVGMLGHDPGAGALGTPIEPHSNLFVHLRGAVGASRSARALAAAANVTAANATVRAPALHLRCHAWPLAIAGVAEVACCARAGGQGVAAVSAAVVAAGMDRCAACRGCGVSGRL